MAAKAPVALTQNDKEIAVVLSRQDYDRLVHRNIASFQRFCDETGSRARARGLTDEALARLLADES